MPGAVLSRLAQRILPQRVGVEQASRYGADPVETGGEADIFPNHKNCRRVRGRRNFAQCLRAREREVAIVVRRRLLQALLNQPLLILERQLQLIDLLLLFGEL